MDTTEDTTEVQEAAARLLFTALPQRVIEDTERLLRYRDRLIFPIRSETGCPIIQGCAKGTLKKYNYYLKQLAQFSLLVGCDQTGLLLFRELCPDMPGPVVASTLCSFLSYKCSDTGELILHHRTGEFVINCQTNEPIRADGAWNCPSTLQSCLTAIAKTHNLYPDLLGDQLKYSSACSECLANYRRNLNTGEASPPRPCRTCALVYNRAQVLPRGFVLSDPEVTTHVIKMRNNLKGHQRSGCIQLLPKDVRQIRLYLLHACPGDQTKCLQNLQVYCMMLVGINLFLRSEELLELKFSSFVPAYTAFHRTNKRIQWLVFKVKGKTDDHEHYLRLWANSCHPELCPVNHLLIYIAMSGRTDGFLFPSFQTPDGKFEYDKFLDIMKNLCTEVIHYKNQPRRFGTHILRKTAYLFAIFGVMESYGSNGIVATTTSNNCVDGISLANIMSSARHKSVVNAQTYAMDAVNHFQGIQTCGDPVLRDLNAYRQWHPIHVGFTALLERLTPHSVFLNKPLQFSAKWFYESRLHLTRDNTVLEAISSACNTVSNQYPSDALHELHKYITANFTPTPQQAATIKGYLEVIAGQCALQNESPIKSESAVEKIVSPPLEQRPSQGSSTTTTSTSLSPPKNHYGTVRLEFRFDPQWLQLDLQAQVKMLVNCSQIPCKQLTNSARTFYYQTALPISRCIKNCFGNNIQQFIDHLQEDLGIAKIRKGKAHKHKCPQCLQRAASTGTTST